MLMDCFLIHDVDAYFGVKAGSGCCHQEELHQKGSGSGKWTGPVAYRLRPLAHATVLRDTLRQLIPIKTVADTLVQTYIDRFEIIHRVLKAQWRL
jgi:uncharacterized spore protein YtfJ